MFIKLYYLIYVPTSTKQRQRRRSRTFYVLRDGMINKEQNILDCQYILKNQVQPNRLDEFKDDVHLFPDKAAWNKYNGEMLRNLKIMIT